MRAGDTIVHLPDREEHTLRAGPDGLEYIVFGTRHPVEYGWLPRSRAMRFGYLWLEGRDDNPWEIEADVGELEFAEPGERPANVVAWDDVPFDEDGDKALADGCRLHSDRAQLGAPRGRNRGLGAPLPLGRRGGVRHSRRRGNAVADAGSHARRDADAEGEYPVRPGHVIARRPASRVAHQLRAGAEALTYLAYGTRDPNDIVYYPESGEIFLRGVGVAIQSR